MVKKLNKIKLSKEDQGLYLLMKQSDRNEVIDRNEIMKVLSKNKK